MRNWQSLVWTQTLEKSKSLRKSWRFLNPVMGVEEDLLPEEGKGFASSRRRRSSARRRRSSSRKQKIVKKTSSSPASGRSRWRCLFCFLAPSKAPLKQTLGSNSLFVAGLLLATCGRIVIGYLWHESNGWLAVARILLLVSCGTNLIVGFLWHESYLFPRPTQEGYHVTLINGQVN